MFSFHKPKVYRSSTGCCICRAKSSSSRFTDSRKYEDNLMDCFSLSEQRTGEICNACVLLVKRYKKLPDGSVRNWHHVVDARAGPGTKSLAKFKAKNKKKPKLRAELREISPSPSDDLSSDISGVSRQCSPAPCDDNIPRLSRKRAKNSPPPSSASSTSSSSSSSAVSHLHQGSPLCSGFIDLNFWKKKKICCGVIYTGPYGAAIVDPKLLKPCQGCRLRNQIQEQVPELQPPPPQPQQPAHGDRQQQQSPPNNKDKVYSDSSSDSGYDDSNQSVPEAGKQPQPQQTTNNNSNTSSTTVTNTQHDSVIDNNPKPLPVYLSQPITQTNN